MQSKWRYLSEGSYNKVYRNPTKTIVAKVRKFNSDITDTPERSVRIWNEINQNIFPPAKLVNLNGKAGWQSSYIEGRQSTDQEISHALINIFNATGRVVVDAVGKKNFLTTKSGQVVCVDIGMALLLEPDGEQHAVPKHIKRGSLTSTKTWSLLHPSYYGFYHSYFSSYPNTVNTIKAILF